jgi:hypothetical protein
MVTVAISWEIYGFSHPPQSTPLDGICRGRETQASSALWSLFYCALRTAQCPQNTLVRADGGLWKSHIWDRSAAGIFSVLRVGDCARRPRETCGVCWQTRGTGDSVPSGEYLGIRTGLTQELSGLAPAWRTIRGLQPSRSGMMVSRWCGRRSS